MTRDLPVLYSEKKNCCGCGACYQVCPTHSIEMKMDKEGFLYPEVDSNKCIRCYKCLAVCLYKD